jgi:hypothetical protein
VAELIEARWHETCARCGNTLWWWRSRHGYRVCMVCAKDPMAALEVLARRAGAQEVYQVRAWQAATAGAEGSSN